MLPLIPFFQKFSFWVCGDLFYAEWFVIDASFIRSKIRDSGRRKKPLKDWRAGQQLDKKYQKVINIELTEKGPERRFSSLASAHWEAVAEVFRPGLCS